MSTGISGGTSRSALARILVINSAVYAVVGTAIVLLVGGFDRKFVGLSFVLLFASASVGIVAGFMFGAPRTSAAREGRVSGSPRLILSSNLVKVSDWLTTIIIGLGLVQFRSVLDGLGWLAARFQVMFAGQLPPEAAGAYGLALLFSSFCLAFVVMYLWTAATIIDAFGDVGGHGVEGDRNEDRK